MASPESRQIYQSFVKSSGNAPKSVEEERQEWENSVEEANRTLTATITPAHFNNINAEWVSHPDSLSGKAILFFHGGGFNSGSCKTHRYLASHLAATTRFPVLLFDYRLAPENPFPAALDDSVTVYKGLLAKGYSESSIVFGGDSAGAGLALSTLLKIREEALPLPAAAFLISPWLDLALTGPSIQKLQDVDPLVNEKDLRRAAGLYLDGADPYNPLASPLYGEPDRLPPLLVQTGEYEMLRDDSLRLAERATKAGVKVQLEVWDEMWHVWPAWVGSLPEAQAALEHIKEFIINNSL